MKSLVARAGLVLALALSCTAGTCGSGKPYTAVVVTDAFGPTPLQGPFYAVAESDQDAQLLRADTAAGPWTRLAPPGVETIGLQQLAPSAATLGLYQVRFTPTGHAAALDPFASDRLYVIGRAKDESFAYRSDDRGNTWTRLTTGLPAPVDANRGFSFVAPDPQLPDRVWLGSTDVAGGPILHRSDDRGATWTAVSTGLTGRYAHGIVFDAQDPNVRLLLVEGAIARTSDAGLTWQDHGQGLPAKRVLGLLVADPVVPGRAYVALASDTATVLYQRDSGVPAWTALAGAGLPRASTDPQPPAALAVDPQNAQRLLVYSVPYVLESRDGGGTFAPVGKELDSYVHGLAFDRAAPSNVLAVTGGVAVSRDGGLSWQLLSQFGLPIRHFRAGL